MSLYEDEDLGGATDVAAAAGWSKGVKLMQSQMQLKKAAFRAPAGLGGSASGGGQGSLAAASAPPQPLSRLRPGAASAAPVLAPVIDLNKKGGSSTGSPSLSSSLYSGAGGSGSGGGLRNLEDPQVPVFGPGKRFRKPASKAAAPFEAFGSLLPLNDQNWQPVNEYDPQWPNDFNKVVQEMKESKLHQDDEGNSKPKRRYTESGGGGGSGGGGRDKAGTGRDRHHHRRDHHRDHHHHHRQESSGFGRRPKTGEDDYSDEEDDKRGRKGGRRSGGGSGGAAIAPPPSLMESSQPAAAEDPAADGSPSSTSAGGLGIAAKIMAKYGYRQGQGLGRAEQGMSSALAVEKTSKRGGRIVHEKDLMPPPMFGESFKTPTTPMATATSASPIDAGDDSVEARLDAAAAAAEPAKPSIADMMRNPSKVVLCKNMVGPGEVDDDLEPEVKEECNGKYGDVASVLIFEMPNNPPEEAVRIFIEFKRVESAIKAVVDLNGRFFGGRTVQACFYSQERYKNLSLAD